MNGGDARRALEYNREALAQFEQSSESGWQAIAYNNTAYHALLAGQPHLALEMAGAGLEIARRIGSFHTRGWLLSTLGEAQTHLGMLEAAHIHDLGDIQRLIRESISEIQNEDLNNIARPLEPGATGPKLEP